MAVARVCIVVNAWAGACARSGDGLASALRIAFGDAGLEADVRMVGASIFPHAVRAARDAGYDAVVAGGGDGTLQAAARELLGGPVPLGVLPLGTRNHFARDLGIPRDLEAAARVVAALHVRAVDVMTLGDRVILNNSSIGLYPALVRARDRRGRGMRRPRAWSRALVEVLWRFPHYRVRLRTPAGEHDLRTPLVFVGNNEPLLPDGRRARLDSGRLFVCAAPAAGRARLLGAVARALLGRHPAAGLTCAWGTELVIDMPRRHVWVALDGEVRRVRPPLVYRLRPGALQVLAPPAEGP